MIKQRTFSLLVVALLMAAGAVWVANNWLNMRSPVTEGNSDEVAVVIAALEIPYGQVLEAQHMKTITMPRQAVTGDIYTDPKELVNKVVKSAMLPGDIIRAERVVDHLGGSTLAALIEVKKRAITIRVDDVIGVAGFLLPGNHVDILATRMGKGKAITDTILKNIKVLAVDQTAAGDNNEPVVVRAVTLELTPEQAETLVKSRDEGRIQLALRNPQEEVAQPKPVVVKTNIKPSSKSKWKPKPAPITSVTVIRGVKPTTTKVKI